ncbi:MAG: alkaline phosphatase family protein, partial [Acidobacteriota bacterium]
SFKFPFNPVIALNGIGRFHLMTLDDEIRLYLSPIQFDPTALPPIFDISHPRELAKKLAGRFGLFKTIGWAIDTWSLSEGTFSEEAFFDDLEFTVQRFESMLYGHLEDDKFDVLVHYFEFPDRVQHMFYRFFDPKHPGWTQEGADQWGDSILDSYKRMDQIVGETMKRLPPDTGLIIVSDHGFSSFRRGMNYNTWLAKNGYMKLKGEDSKRMNLEDLFDKGDFFANVDWSGTRAYALGLGQIYINVAGRESKGIVQPGAEYDALVAEIKAGLEGFVDEETGEHPVAYVWTRDEAYGTYDPELIPDMIPSNADGYRVGWQDSLGGIAKTIVEDNDRVWSGDHCSLHPPLVPGILFSSLKLDVSEPAMGDVMPTILDIFDVEPTAQLDGRSLLIGAGEG